MAYMYIHIRKERLERDGEVTAQLKDHRFARPSVFGCNIRGRRWALARARWALCHYEQLHSFPCILRLLRVAI